MRDSLGGCVRRQGASTCRSGEGFVKLVRVKMPDTSVARVDMSLSLKECRQECLRNCSCTAYSNADENKGRDWVLVISRRLGRHQNVFQYWRTRFVYTCGCSCTRYFYLLIFLITF